MKVFENRKLENPKGYGRSSHQIIDYPRLVFLNIRIVHM